MEAQDVGFSAFYLQAVHQEIVVVDIGRCCSRIGNDQIENADVTLVKIGLKQIGTGELPDGVVVFQAGDTACPHHLPPEGRVLGMVYVRNILR